MPHRLFKTGACDVHSDHSSACVCFFQCLLGCVNSALVVWTWCENEATPRSVTQETEKADNLTSCLSFGRNTSSLEAASARTKDVSREGSGAALRAEQRAAICVCRNLKPNMADVRSDVITVIFGGKLHSQNSSEHEEMTKQCDHRTTNNREASKPRSYTLVMALSWTWGPKDCLSTSVYCLCGATETGSKMHQGSARRDLQRQTHFSLVSI